MTLLYLAAIAVGIVLLVWGARLFVTGAAATAHDLGISSIMIGLTIVGFGTSAPELIVSANAALSGSPDIAIGNALGSNIANIGLILGVCAVLVPLTVGSGTLARELPIAAGASILAMLPFLDGVLSRADGLLLFGSLIVIMAYLIWAELRDAKAGRKIIDHDPEIPHDLPLTTAIRMSTTGLIVLLASSWLLVFSARELALGLGVSELVVGVSVIALGTSLPELAASVTAARQGEHDIAIGNVVGSNLYNILAVTGVAGVLSPLQVDPDVLVRDFPVMVGLTIILCITAYGLARIARSVGVVFLITYIGYHVYVFAGALG